MPVPAAPKIYHIVHVDKLPGIVADGCLWCDAEIVRRAPAGTTIGMRSIKQKRLDELTLSSHPDLRVGGCVPFYFCPRSVMLFVIHYYEYPSIISSAICAALSAGMERRPGRLGPVATAESYAAEMIVRRALVIDL